MSHNKQEEVGLIKEFKRGMNEMIQRKLIEAERPLTSIEQ